MTTKLKSLPILVVILSLLALQSIGQQKTVSGKVVDNQGAAIAGATVTVKGTNVATQTNAEGSFTLSAPAGATRLVITAIGFGSLDVAISASGAQNIVLQQSQSNLNEVVVVGYGTQRKRELTSAITSVSSEQFNKGNVPNVAQLLQGKVAGLSITRAGSNPNRGFDIRLRGISTIGANTQPLVVVDGQVGADLNTIDPNDIANIDVLKDGSSAAIYGTRGSAGVIIITTRKGTANQARVSYNSGVTIDAPFRFLPSMNAEEFRAQIKLTGIGTDYGASTDWNDAITRNAFSHFHNVSFSGGTAKTTYLLSVNYRNTEGVAIRTGFKQMNGRGNITHKALNDKLVLSMDLSATRKSSDLGFEKAFQYAAIYNPTSPIYAQKPEQDLAKGGFFEVSATEYSNPYAMLVQNTNHSDFKRTNLTGTAEYEIIKGLKILGRFAQQYSNDYLSAYTPSNAFIDRGFYNGVTGVARRGYSYKRSDEYLNNLYESTISYARKFNKLDFSGVAGYSYQDFMNQGYALGAGDFVSDLSGQNFATAQDFNNARASASSYKNASKLIAFFGRVTFNYDNWAFLQASLRREGSSTLGANNRWGYFPAVSAGLDLAKKFDLKAFSSLKLRGSYGVTGALPPAPYLSQYLFNANGSYLINGSFINTYGPSQNPNPDLKWEKKAEIDVGVDFAVLDNRLSGTIDYYTRKTTNLIFNVFVPSPPNFFDRAFKNVGDLKGSGLEVLLNYKIFQGDKFSWNTSINYSKNNVKLTYLDPSAGSFIGQTNLGSPGQEATQITRTYAGGLLGAFYNAIYRGLDANGRYLFDDGTGKAVLASQTNYKGVIGNGIPKFEMGFTNSLTYKNWDFNIFFRGAFGHQIVNTNRAFYESPTVTSVYNVVNTKYFTNSLKEPQQLFSSLFVEKGDFVKLDNATIGYNFNLKPNAGFKSIRAYVTGQNLLLITGYTGVDPEVRWTDNGNVLAPGIDRRETWVIARGFTFGLNVGL